MLNFKKTAVFRAAADIAEIYINTTNAEINIVSTAEPNLYIEYSKNLRPIISETDGKVALKQRKSLTSSFLRPFFTVYVPECNVPDVTLTAEKCNLKINGGIYNDAVISGREIRAEINSAAFENLKIKADELDVSADGILVKNLSSALAADGRVEIDKAFCKKAECRVKKGNIGLCNSACDFAVLNSEEGNIAASMLGCESEYTIALDGAAVSGKDNLSTSGKSIRARAAKGSVVLDFSNPPRFNEAEELEYREEARA